MKFCSAQGGFTLTETMIVALVFVPILLGVVRTTGSVADSVDTTDTISANSESIHGILERVAKQIRSGQRTSFETRALQVDVDNAVATSVGEWIDAVEMSARKSIRFRSAIGTLSLNASASTPVREYLLALEDGESANGIDDDKDGLVDECSLILKRGAVPIVVARGVESFVYELDGRTMTLQIRVARTDGKKRVHRSTASQVLYIRNK